jgi:predicted nucleic acid-binding protein
MIIVDTGFWLALANQDDKHHTKARQVMQNLREPLITTWFVFTETCYLLLTRLGNHSQVLFIENFLAGRFEIFEIKISPPQADGVWKMFCSQTDGFHCKFGFFAASSGELNPR